LENLCSALRLRHSQVQFMLGCAVEGVGMNAFDLQNAVSSADIICTATPSTRPLFKAHWVKAGTHLNLIGSYTIHMAEVEDDLIRRAGKILVDSREACQREAGELVSAGIALRDMVEVGQVLEMNGDSIQNEIANMKSAGDVTIFKSVGLGVGTQIEAYDVL